MFFIAQPGTIPQEAGVGQRRDHARAQVDEPPRTLCTYTPPGLGFREREREREREKERDRERKREKEREREREREKERKRERGRGREGGREGGRTERDRE
jgi:hypothetical protein